MLRSFAYNAFFSCLLNLFAVGLEEEIFMDFNLDNFGPSYKALISCHVELFCFNFIVMDIILGNLSHICFCLKKR